MVCFDKMKQLLEEVGVVNEVCHCLNYLRVVSFDALHNIAHSQNDCLQ